MKPDEMAGAEISDCGLYRYRLWRRWGSGAKVLWIMLNPSTADACTDDPTIRRCASFTRAWGADAFEVVNLFALRTTDPRELRLQFDPCGPQNPRQLRISMQKRWKHIVAAWGAGAAVTPSRPHGAESYVRWLYEGKLECLGVTKAGHPRHPLYLPKTAELQPWPADRAHNADAL